MIGLGDVILPKNNSEASKKGRLKGFRQGLMSQDVKAGYVLGDAVLF